MTTRDGYPELWGQSEIADYADAVAKELKYPIITADGRRIPTHRPRTWLKLPGFPEVLADLAMGPVYLAEEVAPWVDQHLRKDKVRRGRTRALDPALRTAIELDRGAMSEARAAAKHGVSSATVHRVWKRMDEPKEDKQNG